MKKLFFLLLVAGAIGTFQLAPAKTLADVNHLVPAEKKVKASVTGAGKSRSEAENEAAKAARQVSGGSYSTVSKSTSGSGTNYVCTMVIEYTQK